MADLFDLVAQLPDPVALARLLKRPDVYRLDSVEAICDRAERACPDSPMKAAEIAEIAVDLSAKVPAFWSREERTRIKAKALRVCGGCYRVMNNHRRAEAAYFVALGHLRKIDSPSELVALCQSFALLRGDQRRLEEAKALVALAVEFSTELPPTDQGRALVVQGSNMIKANNLDAAIAPLRRARIVLRGLDQDLFFSATQGLTLVLSERAEPPDRQELRGLVAELGKILDSQPNEARVAAFGAWAQGLAARRLGDHHKALTYLDLAVDTFLDLGIPVHFAVSSLDRAIVQLRVGNIHAVQKSVPRIVEFLSAFQLNQECQTAVSLLRETTKFDHARLQLIRNTILG